MMKSTTSFSVPVARTITSCPQCSNVSQPTIESSEREEERAKRGKKRERERKGGREREREEGRKGGREGERERKGEE